MDVGFFNPNRFGLTLERFDLDVYLNGEYLGKAKDIRATIIPGNDKVKTIATQLQQHGFDVKPILSPTVPEGQERLRFCLHSYNSEAEIMNVLELLATFVF